MSEYREALQRVVDEMNDPVSYPCPECTPAFLDWRLHNGSSQCAYHAAKALLARPEPEPSELVALLRARGPDALLSEAADFIEHVIGNISVEHAAAEKAKKPLDLQSLCDRLNEVFNEDDTPWELCQEAIEAIERLWEERDAAAAEKAREQLSIALGMLADWCVAVDENGTGWDDWDEHYKDAMYRPGPLREALDAEILEARKRRGLPSPPAATGETE